MTGLIRAVVELGIKVRRLDTSMSITEKSDRTGSKREMVYEQVSSQPVATVRSWGGVASDTTFIGELQEALEGCKVLSWTDLDIGIRVRLRVGAGRLAKVRRLGGIYEQISLSPELEAIEPR